MADADSTLQIQIEILAKTYGADQVQSALNKTKEVAGDAGAATGKLNDATNEGAKAAGKSEISHRALHQILHLIGRESGPAVGAAFSAIAALTTGGMMAGIMAVRQLFEWLSQAAAQAKKFKEAMEAKIDISGLVGDVGGLKQSVADAGTEIDNFFAKLKQGAAGHEFKKIADEQIAHLQRVAEAEKKLAGEQAEREKARLDFLKETHQISEAEYKAGVQAANDLKGKKESSITGNLDSQSEAALHQASLNIIAQIEEAGRALTNAKGKPGADRHLETLVGLLKATQDNLAKVEAVQNEPQGFWSAAGSYYYDTFKHPMETAEAFQQRISDELGSEMNELRAQEASLRRQIAETKKTAPDSEKIKGLEDKINALLADKTSIESELGKREDQGTVNRDAGTAGQVQKFLEAQARLLHHQGTKDDSQTVAAMNQLLQTSQQSDNRMFLLVKDLIAHHGDLNAALADLARQLGEVKTRTSRPTS